MSASDVTIMSPSCANTFTGRVNDFARDIKISHTVFAMPWAVLSTVMAWKRVGGPIWGKLGLILVCMVSARTMAMASNRLLDAELDRKNPRTARRAIPSGRLSYAFVTGVLLFCVAVFIGATGMFELLYRNPWPVVLALPVLVFISSYPLLKRFTRLCHYYLGASLALAPVCAWIAIAGTIGWPAIIMAGTVLCWTAGFDIIYACQDYRSDLETGVVSVPSKLGIAKALWVSRATHVVSFGLLVLLGLVTPEYSAIYFSGVACVAVLLVVEHSLVGPNDLSKAGLAFFTVNGIISVLVCTLGVIDLFY